MNKETGRMLNYRKWITHADRKVRKVWLASAANEYERLAQGDGRRVKSTNTINFIKKKNIPSDRQQDVTYGVFNCTERSYKIESNTDHAS